MILYHGSRHGINGPIAPISRDRCDFGRGFYLGTNPLQPLTLICDFPDARFYTVELELDGLDVRELSPDTTWALVVAYHRRKGWKAPAAPSSMLRRQLCLREQTSPSADRQ